MGKRRNAMMTYDEAKKVLEQIDLSKRMVDGDGRIWKAIRITQRAEEARRIVDGEMEADKAILLTPKEAQRLETAVKANMLRPVGMTVNQAKKIMADHTTPSGKVVLDGAEGDQVWQVLSRSAEAIFFAAHPEAKGTSSLSKAESKALRSIAKNTQAMMARFDRERRKHKKESVWKRLTGMFRRSTAPKKKPEAPKKEPFYFENPNLWQEVKFPRGDQILFSYRINTSRLTPKQKTEVKTRLEQMGIKYTERRATTGEWVGDETIRLADEESIDTFREMVLHHARQPGWRRSAISRAEYEAIQKKRREPAVAPAPAREKPAVETDKTKKPEMPKRDRDDY